MRTFVKRAAAMLLTASAVLCLASCRKKAEKEPPSDTALPTVCENVPENENKAEAERTETLLITTTVFSNGVNYDDGVELIVYECDTQTLELTPGFPSENLLRLPCKYGGFFKRQGLFCGRRRKASL